MEHLKPLMLAGTGSDVGKSIVATALCRIFLQDGYRPAPFKAQNMALNSYATPDGLEIGRAQAVQAEACQLAPHTDMNPLLLKPNSNHTSQVVLHGRPIGNRNAYDFWSATTNHSAEEGGTHRTIDFRAEVCAAFDRLASRYNPVVMEGAGSVAELNLRDHDLVNLPMARHADAAVVLVADIDRGGVFASCYGSIMLQTPEYRRHIRGIIVNKFRGDLRLFEQGRHMLEEICGVPVLGVIPYLDNLHIDAEDSVVLERLNSTLISQPTTLKIRIAVLLLRHLSNFTDFDVLERDARVHLFYTDKPEDILQADIIIIPGTKATLDDLYHVRRSGMGAALLKAHAQGATLMGICGGFQMLGQRIDDPDGIEGSTPTMPGLGLLPMTTVMTPEKTTRQVEFTFQGQHCRGYEIHHGQSTASDPIAVVGNVIGTYIHGCLDNPAVIDYLLSTVGRTVSCPSSQLLTPQTIDDVERLRQQEYDRLADHVRRHLDMHCLYDILTPNS